MAKDVITRFKLETTAFDSKIKQASKELSDYSKTATQAKEGFNQFTKANVDAARALGTMATSSNNTKVKVQELVGAYNEAAKAYEKLSDEQKQSDWAKALAGSLTQLQQRIKDAKQEMQGLGNEMKSSGLFGGGKLDGMLQVFGGNLMTKAAGSVAQLGSEMYGMVQQGIEMAKAGEGVRIAFERLGRGDILDGLREATHGTVTDLELMKAAVKFNDFKLPVEELGTMLAFAQQKAKDTGQSVDYMVDSIVTGLGRKSLMILDNLGLSAAEIKEKMKQTGDMTKAVGEIIREQMAKAGDYVETAADRAAQANVSLQNKMEELGRKFAPVEEASNQLWTSMKIGILDLIGGPLATLLNQLTEAGRMRNALNNINAMGGEGQTLAVKHLGTLLQYSASHNTADVESLAKRQVARYAELEAQEWKKYNQQRSKLNQLRSEYGSGWGVGGGLEKDMEASRNRALAWRQVSAEYQAGAKQILSPVKPAIDPRGAELSNGPAAKEVTSMLKIDELGNITISTTESMKQLQAQLRDYQQKLSTATNAFDQYSAQQGIEQTQKKIDAQPMALSLGWDTESVVQLQDNLDTLLEDMRSKIKDNPLKVEVDTNGGGLEELNNDAKVNMEAWGAAASAVQNLGNALQSLEDPSAKIAGIVGQAVANIALGFAQATASPATGAAGVFGWIAAATAGLATMVATITQIKSVTKGGFAEGGIVPGNSFSGDNIRAYGLNSGELILSMAQQNSIAGQLQGAGGNSGGDTTATVSAETLKIVLKNGASRRGKNVGEWLNM